MAGELGWRGGRVAVGRQEHFFPSGHGLPCHPGTGHLDPQAIEPRTQSSKAETEGWLGLWFLSLSGPTNKHRLTS